MAYCFLAVQDIKSQKSYCKFVSHAYICCCQILKALFPNFLLLKEYSILTFFQLIRKVFAMEFIDGIPIMNLGDEMAKRGIDPGGKFAALAKQ